MENNDNKQPEQTSKQSQSAQTDTTQQSSSGNNQPSNDKKHHAKRAGKIAGLTLLIILLIATVGGGAYWWRGSLAESREAELENEIGDLEMQIERLEEEESEEESEPDETTETDLSETIEAAVSTGNYSELEEHMSDPVLVIVAASEGHGPQEPSEAVQSLEYLDSASGSWDFDLSDSVLSSWRNDFYGQFFPTGAVVGRSSDDFVVSFNFDSSGDISAIFLAADADLLTDQTD